MMAIRHGNCVKQIVTIFLSFGMLALPASAQPPETPVRVVKEDFFGRQIEDPYRWLENIRDPEVLKWLTAQSDHTRSTLDRIPVRKDILARIRDLDATLPPQPSVPAVDGKGRIFYFRNNSAGVSIGYMFDPA